MPRLWDRLADWVRTRAQPAGDHLPSRLGPFRLHQANPATDRAALLAAYASSRENDPDLLERHPESRQAVIEHEFESRQLSYRIDFPGVEFYRLELGHAPAGRLYLQSAPGHVFLVDLVLLPPCRGRGHGTALLQDLIRHAHASGRPLRLHVAKTNPRAAALYHRLGFHQIEELTQHRLLERPPPGPTRLNTSGNY